MTVLLAVLVGWLPQGPFAPRPIDPPCTVEPEPPPATPGPATRGGLLYRRAFLGDEPVRSPWIEAVGVTLSAEPAEPGAGLRLRGAAGGHLRIAPESTLPMALAERMAVTVYAPKPIRVELELVDGITGARLLRPLALVEGSQRLDAALVDFHYERGRVALASRAVRWGLHFVDAGELELRAVELLGDGSTSADDRLLATLRETFDDPGQVHVHRRGAFALLTDAPALDVRAVLDALDGMHAHTRAVLPSMPPLRSVVPLLVFRDDAAYRRFWRRTSARVGRTLAPLSADEGYTWQGIATASFDDRYGAVRPTYVHEAHHALFERAWDLAAQRSWLFEGLAVLEQLPWSRQDLAPVYRRGLRRADAMSHLRELLDGRPIATERYWQATLFVRWLLSDPGRTAALDAAMVEMAARGSTELAPLAPRDFGSDLRALGREFWSWAWVSFGI